MEKSKRLRLPVFFLLSYFIFIPMINEYLKILEKCFGTNLHTLQINGFNIFTILFHNGIITITWILLNVIIGLVIKNIQITKENAKIEVEGINLKKKDRNFWNSRLGIKRRNRRVFKHWKKRWNYFRRNRRKRTNNTTNKYIFE